SYRLKYAPSNPLPRRACEKVTTGAASGQKSPGPIGKSSAGRRRSTTTRARHRLRSQSGTTRNPTEPKLERPGMTCPGTVAGWRVKVSGGYDRPATQSAKVAAQSEGRK